MKPSTFLRGAGALAVAAAFLHAGPAGEPRRVRVELSARAEEPAVWAVDVDGGARGGPARLVPSEPFEQQQRPPCKSTQEALSGGCWYRLARRPPCGPEQYERGDGCFLPVIAVAPRPVGVQR